MSLDSMNPRAFWASTSSIVELAESSGGTSGDREVGLAGPVDIVLAADRRYFEILEVALASIAAHRPAGEVYRVWIATEDGSAEDLMRWAGIGRRTGLEVHRVTVDRRMLPLAPTSGHISVASYFRVLLPDLLPSEVGRFVYLDCDLVVETGIGGLLRHDLGGRVLGAVEDVLIRRNRLPGVAVGTPYFNAGVMVVDRRAWDAAGVGREALRRLREQPGVLRFHDQDLLNWVVQGDWRAVDPRWNQQSAMWELGRRRLVELHADPKSLLETPHIIHFSGYSKPWEYSCDHPLGQRYWHYRGIAGLGMSRPVAPSLKELLRKAVKSVVGFRYRFLFRAVLRGLKQIVGADKRR